MSRRLSERGENFTLPLEKWKIAKREKIKCCESKKFEMRRGLVRGVDKEPQNEKFQIFFLARI